MPPPKKAAKKAPAKSAPKHDEGKDLRRAHEHRGRVEVLRPSLVKNVADIDTLVKLAEQELAGSHPKDAADLLRAAEHLSFGYLASSKTDGDIHPKLSDSTEEEFQHKLEKAEEHWEESDALSGIYRKALDGAQKAFDDGALRRAMELARAAEAIAHVHLHDDE
jgi:Na+/phosphate symporter